MIAGTVAFVRWRKLQIERIESPSTVVETAQGPVEYAIAGEGPEVLVLHGTIGGYDQLQPMVKLLNSGSYRFIFVSRPGYLRTPLSTGETFEEQADAYAALLDELGIDQVAVVAMSGGGPSALQFALRYPERCWGMVMLSANADVQAGRADKADKPSSESARQPPRLVTNLIFSDLTSWLLVGASRLLPRQFLTVLVGKEYVEGVLTDPAKRTLYAELADSLALLSRRRAGALNDGEQFLTFTGVPFGDITAPMLILHGASDNAVSTAEPRHLDATVPNSRYIEIEGGTHFMLISHHDILSPLILDFLDAHVP
jgi:pimeloyl-ACP methyl ester carboxylesterase